MTKNTKHILYAVGAVALVYIIYRATQKPTTSGNDANFSNAAGEMHTSMLPPLYYTEGSGFTGTGGMSPKEIDGYNFYVNKPSDFITRAIDVINSTKASTNAELQRLPVQGGPMTTKKRLQYRLRALDTYLKTISMLPKH